VIPSFVSFVFAGSSRPDLDQLLLLQVDEDEGALIAAADSSYPLAGVVW
jgi:hypothetical protein